MTIKEGDKIPEATLMTMTETGPKPMTTKELFDGKKVALFSVPGAFTPTCSAQHLPGFVENADKIKPRASTPSPASPSMTPSSWTPGARIARLATRF